MKRRNAITMTWALAGGTLVILLALLAGFGTGGAPAALAHGGITVNGEGSDWFPMPPFPAPPTDNAHVLRTLGDGEFVWADDTGDHRTDGTDPDSNYDLTEFRVTADDTNLYFLLGLADVTVDSRPYVAIAVDTDRASGSGSAPFADSAGISTAPSAAWERQIVANSNRTGYFDTTPTFNSAGASAFSASNDLVEISMPLTPTLGIDLDGGAVVRFTVFVGEHDGSGGVVSYGGNGVLDVITRDASDTASEVADGVLNYYFDVYFEPDGDPTSPLQISEVFYNPISSGGPDLAPDSHSNEFVELYNPAQYLAYLDGALLGDEPGPQVEIQNFEANFQFPGTAVTGTAYPLDRSEYAVIAIDAKEYDDDPPRPGDNVPAFPDHHWADWELFQGLTGEFDHPMVPNLARVYGPSSGTANDTQFALGTNDDEVFLADGTVTSTIPVSTTVIDGMNYGTGNDDTAAADTAVPDANNANTIATGLSFQRDYTQVTPDTDDSNNDFAGGAPTPGFAAGMIDHALYMSGTNEVEAGQTYDYFLYYQIAGQDAPSVAVSGVLPNGFEYISATANTPVTGTWTAPNLDLDLGDIPASTIGKITVTVQVAPDVSGGAATLAFQIDSASTDPEGIASNDSASLNLTVRAPNLSIAKTVEAVAPVQLGDPVTYTVVLANGGDADAVGVLVTDTLPSGVTGADLATTATVAAGDQITYTIAATVTTDEAFFGNTIVNLAEYAHDSGSGSDTAAFTIASPNLIIGKMVDTPHTPVHPGDTVTYTVSVDNTGTATASNVHITDTLPSGLSGVGLDENVTVTVGGLVTFAYSADVTDSIAFYGQDILNTAYFNHTSGNGSAQASFTIVAPMLAVAKTVQPASGVELGDIVTYTVSIANDSPADALGVALTDVLPLGVTFGGWLDQGSAMQTGGTITWGPTDVTQAQSYTFSFTATVTTSSTFKGQNVVNTVQFGSDNAGSGSSDATFAIQADFMLYMPVIVRSTTP